jgi:hypothetical protein
MADTSQGDVSTGRAAPWKQSMLGLALQVSLTGQGIKGVGDCLAGQKGRRPTLVGIQPAVIGKIAKAVWGFFLTTRPGNANVQNTPHQSWKSVSMKVNRKSTSFIL